MKVYKSGYFNIILYGLITIGVLIPGIWVLLFSFSKHNYNWPFIIVGCILCSYPIYILQKQFSYKVTLQDDFLEINYFDKVTNIRYKDIIDLKFKKDACYIIDKYEIDDEYFIRGTTPLCKFASNNLEVRTNIFELPVIQKSFLENYNELINALICKLNKKIDIDVLAYPLPYNNTVRLSFVSLALLKNNKENVTIFEAFDVLSPYIVIIFVSLMSLFTYEASNRGLWSNYSPIYFKLIFPVIAVISIYFLTIKFINYIKNSMNRKIYKPLITRYNIIIFITINIIISFAVIMLFFYVSKSTNLIM